MIDIIAVNIKQGGGLVLLKLLISEMINKKINSTIHLSRNIDFTEFDENPYVKFKTYTSFFSKIMVFGKGFTRALYFGNLPPFFLRGSNNYLYFHNPFYLKPYKILFRERHWKFIFQKLYIFFLIKNVKSVFVQTKSVSESFKRNFGIEPVIAPFFQDLSCFYNDEKIINYDFAYISLPNPNKNFDLFFRALSILNKKLTRAVHICLTIPIDNSRLIKTMDNFNDSNIVIKNIGKAKKSEVIEVLNSTRVSVFPSLEETFGLPLLEACQLNNFVVCSNLPFAHDVIEPSLTFNPQMEDDIADKMLLALEGDIKKSKVKVKNKLQELFKILLS